MMKETNMTNLPTDDFELSADELQAIVDSCTDLDGGAYLISDEELFAENTY
jgi:hypothetical protein